MDNNIIEVPEERDQLLDVLGYTEVVRLSTPNIQDIINLEEFLLTLPQTDCEVEHHYIDNVMTRTMFIPKGTLATGRFHKKECINIISKGSVVVWTELGPEILIGPCRFVSPAGLKKVAYALEDTEWTGIFYNKDNHINNDNVVNELTYKNEEQICSDYQQQQ